MYFDKIYNFFIQHFFLRSISCDIFEKTNLKKERNVNNVGYVDLTQKFFWDYQLGWKRNP